MPDNRKELGGYFELEHFNGHEYHEGAIALNCARSCAAYIIEARNIKTLWTPWYLCVSVDRLCGQLGVEVKHFSIRDDFTPDYDAFSIAEDEYLYLVDYYGQLADEQIREAAERAGGRIIVDEVMAFFRKPIDGLDTLNSCRKFFGVADGGYLYTGAQLNRELPLDESHERMDFVLGRCERPANDFYRRSAENNVFFANEPIKRMSPITQNILRGVDYEEVGAKRKANFEALAAELGSINELSPRPTYGAFMYPLLIEEGAAIRKKLQEQKVYVSMLWGRDPMPSGIDGRFALDILPMICDQRYSIDDMKYEADILKQIIANL